MTDNPSDNVTEKNVSTAEEIEHTSLLLRTERYIQNGIAILSKKIVGYAEGVTGTFCTERRYLQVMFAEASV